MTNTITVRGVEYAFISGEDAIDPATQIIWSLLKICSEEDYKIALKTKDPVQAFQNFTASTRVDSGNPRLLFGLNLTPKIEPDPEKNDRVALEENLRLLVPSLPTDLGATRLIEFVNAVLPQQAAPQVAETPAEKKPRKKKGGFGEKTEPEIPTLEVIAGRELTPEEVAAEKTLADKPLEEAIATPLIPISDEELAKLRPDLATIEDQDLLAALAEQTANRLTIVSTPAPPDSDELEELG